MNLTVDRVLHRVGDSCAEDHGGGAVIVTDDGYMFLEWTHGIEAEHPCCDKYDDGSKKLMLDVFQVRLDEPAYGTMSCYGSNVWKDLSEFVGMSEEEILEMSKSDDPGKIAGAYEILASCYGWRSIDPEPASISYEDLESRWE